MKCQHGLLALAVAGLTACGNQPVASPAGGAGETPKSPAATQWVELAEEGTGLEVIRTSVRSRADAIRAPGRMILNEDATWNVGSVTDGKIVEVHSNVGDVVQKSHVLALMHSHDVHTSRAAYKLAKAELERREMLLAQTHRVRDRARRLFDVKAASREQVEAAETEARNAQILVENARTEIEKERIHLTEFLGVPLDAKDSEHDADLVPIKTPASGTVVERFVTPGTVVSQSTRVFTIADLSTLWMIASFQESDLSHLLIGQRVRIHVQAYPGESFGGRVLKLGEQLDPGTRTLQVRVLVPNKEGRLKPEMLATAEITGRSGRPAIFIPDTAVHDVNGQSVVFIRAARGKFEVRRLSIAGTLNGECEISSGLKPGEEIVVKGGLILKGEILKAAEE